MAKKKLPKNVIHLIICAVGIVVLIAVGIIPSYRELGAMDRDIQKLKGGIAEQNKLFPVFIELFRKSREKQQAILPSPDPKSLPRGNTAQISKIIKEISLISGMEIESLKPDIASLTDNTGTLVMTLVSRGKFDSIREFLIELGGVAYLKQIDQIQIEPTQGQQGLKVNMKLSFYKG